MTEPNQFQYRRKTDRSDIESQIERLVTECFASGKKEDVPGILCEMKRALLDKLSRANMTPAIAAYSDSLLSRAAELRGILAEIDGTSSASHVSKDRARRIYLEAYSDLARLKELLVKSSVSGHFHWLRTSGVLDYAKPGAAALPEPERELLTELARDQQGADLIKKILDAEQLSLDADLDDIFGKWLNQIYVFITTADIALTKVPFRTWLFAGAMMFTGAALVGLNLGGFDVSKGLGVGLVQALSSVITGGRLASDAYKLVVPS